MELIVKVNGGLGNQLFQYAAGRALADRVGARLLLDLSFFDLPAGAHTPRAFELDRFNTRFERATENDLRPYVAMARNRWLGRSARLLPFLFPHRRHHERTLFIYEPALRTLSKDTYLDGHWQSEQYFADSAGTIREDLRCIEPIGEANQAMLDAMKAVTPVSLHVRRGDYVTRSDANAVHGTCSIEYYERAMKEIVAHTPDSVFHVFSDDANWARANLPKLRPMIFVTHNTGVSDHFDLLLMAACKHHIIANSSFSWWGAWLNPNPTKQVIAPLRWFRDPAVDTRDLIPHGWKRL